MIGTARPTSTTLQPVGAANPAGLLAQLGVPLSPELLVLALTHRSFAHEAGGLPTNERLEFLGDAVLGVVVTEALFREHPEVLEGDLAKMRAATVSQRPLAAAGRELGLGKYLLLGKGERRSGGADKDSLLADTVEALIGAVYLAHGLETARKLVHRLVGPALAAAGRGGAGLDWKTSLQELAAAVGYDPPRYDVVSTGPDHARTFQATVTVGPITTSGEGTAKRHAEQAAAALACLALEHQGALGRPGSGANAGTA